MFTNIRPRALLRALALGLAVLAALSALLGIQRPGAASAATIHLPARFLNNAEYPIVSLTVDNQQIVPGQAAAIPPGMELTIPLPLGRHTYSAANKLNSGFTMYTFAGSFNLQFNPLVPLTTQSSILRGVTHKLESHAAVFNDPTIVQLLTRFGTNGTWNGQFFDDNGVPHLNTFNFRANGTYVFSADGRALGGNNYTLVSRDPSTQTITFNVGGNLNGVYSETQGMFLMKNDPHGNAIEYN